MKENSHSIKNGSWTGYTLSNLLIYNNLVHNFSMCQKIYLELHDEI